MSHDARTIYAMRHNPTGKIYIGSSYNIDARLKAHLGLLRRGEHCVEQMQRDYDEYGADYSYYILEVLPEMTPNPVKRERWWMDVFKTRNPQYGYNYNEIAPEISLSSFQEYHLLPNGRPGRHRRDK